MPAGRLAALRVAGFFVDWLTGVAVTRHPVRLPRLPAGPPAHGDAAPRRRSCWRREMLLRAVEHGFGIVEVPITPLQLDDRPPGFRPARDGIAIGVFLAVAIVLRWTREATAGALWLVGTFSPARLRARHREAYQSAELAALEPGRLGDWRSAPSSSRGRSRRRARMAIAARARVAPGRGGDRGDAARAGARPQPAYAGRLGLDWLTPRCGDSIATGRLTRTPGGVRAAGGGGVAAGRLRRARGRRGPGRTRARPPSSPAAGSRWRWSSARRFRASTWASRCCPPTCRCSSGSACSTRSKARGFLVKYGAYFHDQETDLELPVLLPRGQAVAAVYLRGAAGRVRPDPARPRRAPSRA